MTAAICLPRPTTAQLIGGRSHVTYEGAECVSRAAGYLFQSDADRIKWRLSNQSAILHPHRRLLITFHLMARWSLVLNAVCKGIQLTHGFALSSVRSIVSNTRNFNLISRDFISMGTSFNALSKVF